MKKIFVILFVAFALVSCDDANEEKIEDADSIVVVCPDTTIVVPVSSE